MGKSGPEKSSWEASAEVGGANGTGTEQLGEGLEVTELAIYYESRTGRIC